MYTLYTMYHQISIIFVKVPVVSKPPSSGYNISNIDQKRLASGLNCYTKKKIGHTVK